MKNQSRRLGSHRCSGVVCLQAHGVVPFYNDRSWDVELGTGSSSATLQATNSKGQWKVHPLSPLSCAPAHSQEIHLSVRLRTIHDRAVILQL